MYSYSMGDFTISSEMYFCKKMEISDKKIFDVVFYENKRICNKFWNSIVKRNYKLRIPSTIGHQMTRLFEKFNYLEHISYDYKKFGRDTDSLLLKYPLQLKLSESELAKGREFLSQLGINKNDKFICLNIRDSAYHGDTTADIYRDSEIDNYILTAENLANKGYYIFRMGSKVHKKFNTPHPHIFDYATNGMRTEFLDIFLASECFFAISTGTGWDSVPALYRKPLVFVNYCPVGYFPSYFQNCLFQSKNHFSTSLNRFLTLTEIMKSKSACFLSQIEFKNTSIELIENSPEEILEISLEMIKILSGEKSTNEDLEIQNKFWKNYDYNLKSRTNLPLHGTIHARHSVSFLKRHPHWLE